MSNKTPDVYLDKDSKKKYTRLVTYDENGKKILIAKFCNEEYAKLFLNAYDMLEKEYIGPEESV